MKVKLLYREKNICDIARKYNLSGWVSWLMSNNPSNMPNSNLLLEQTQGSTQGWEQVWLLVVILCNTKKVNKNSWKMEKQKFDVD